MPIFVSDVQRAVGSPLPTIAAIQSAVAAEFRVPLRIMREPAPTEHNFHNMRPIAQTRQIAMALAFRLTDHSLERIGFFFGRRDHATVWHANRVVTRRARTDPKLHNALRRITLSLVRR